MMLRALARNAGPAARRVLATAERPSSLAAAALSHSRPYSLQPRVGQQWARQALAAERQHFVASASWFSTTNGPASEEAEASRGSSGEEKAADDGGADAAAADGGSADGADAAPSPDEIIADLQAQLAEKHEHMLMAYANEENALRIAKKDVAKAREFAVHSFAKSLLDVADNLQRARDAVPAEAVEGDDEGTKMLRQLLEGVKLTEDGLLKAFQQNGVVRYGEPGDVFDANIHEALYMYQDPTAEPGTLGQVMQTGYMLKERCLRPAKAGIVQAPPASE